ncbi:hypothetical protein CEUSTIGMA_g12754.t1 [Chlamydomonas eustigma]|uniref:Uncharacterized protein n=1 Tax=Chlamydomonas eustigma TaxID=1157962 RepID=A0A250XQJ2_9CHLO|nr:hypothetical protein CEUSTIGMA_g12754.t1 [Chlamydomonas eustigma]|eukprot:GAX85337.1 hypothetical protein CEUSTIGMA_g12754.t1 [Chlamydomonas eustigma]
MGTELKRLHTSKKTGQSLIGSDIWSWMQDRVRRLRFLLVKRAEKGPYHDQLSATHQPSSATYHHTATSESKLQSSHTCDKSSKYGLGRLYLRCKPTAPDVTQVTQVMEELGEHNAQKAAGQTKNDASSAASEVQSIAEDKFFSAPHHDPMTITWRSRSPFATLSQGFNCSRKLPSEGFFISRSTSMFHPNLGPELLSLRCNVGPRLASTRSMQLLIHMSSANLKGRSRKVHPSSKTATTNKLEHISSPITTHPQVVQESPIRALAGRTFSGSLKGIVGVELCFGHRSERLQGMCGNLALAVVPQNKGSSQESVLDVSLPLRTSHYVCSDRMSSANDHIGRSSGSSASISSDNVMHSMLSFCSSHTLKVLQTESCRTSNASGGTRHSNKTLCLIPAYAAGIAEEEQ